MGVGAFVFGGVQLSCGSVNNACAADCMDSEAQQRITDLEARVSTLEAGIAQSTMSITAKVGGATGGTSETACPSGYTLTSVSLVSILVTDGGTGGWPHGTYGCSKVAGERLRVSLANYATGSSQSVIECQGLCVR
jgi:hypothetical protein